MNPMYKTFTHSPFGAIQEITLPLLARLNDCPDNLTFIHESTNFKNVALKSKG